MAYVRVLVPADACLRLFPNPNSATNASVAMAQLKSSLFMSQAEIKLSRADILALVVTWFFS
jgi:hypothetical protein